MGTTCRIVLYARDPRRGGAAAEAAFDRIAALDASLSDYRPDSELSRLTRGPVGTPVAVSDDLFRVLDAAQRMALRSRGAFDITVGPLSQLWRRARRQVALPPPGQLEAARAATGYGLLELDARRRTATMAAPGMRLDAGGIAKGYAADEALAVLEGAGLPRALVAVGGDLAVGDAPPGTAGWQVVLAGLEPGQTAPGSPLALHRAGVSTSGDAEQWVEIDGRRYSHILDPATGVGMTGRRSVSVVARDAMTSDMLATALSVMPVADGAALVEDTAGAAALVATSAGGAVSWHRSQGWRW